MAAAVIDQSVPANTVVMLQRFTGNPDSIRISIEDRVIGGDFVEFHGIFTGLFVIRGNEITQIYSRTGHVLGNTTINIGDALEILKYLAKLDTVLCPVTNNALFEAAKIVNPDSAVPTISDALEILKYLAKIDNVLEEK
jgi:hypothetical protein